VKSAFFRLEQLARPG